MFIPELKNGDILWRDSHGRLKIFSLIYFVDFVNFQMILKNIWMKVITLRKSCLSCEEA